MSRTKSIISGNLFDKYDLAVICDPISIFYFTGVNICDGYLAISEKANYLFVDGRYIEVAQKKAIDCNVVLISSEQNTLYDICVENNFKNIVFSENIKVFEFNRLKSKLSNLTVTTDSFVDKLISHTMSIKDDYEIDCIKKAQNFTDLAFKYILGKIKPGKSELELSYELEFFIKSKCNCDLAFDTIFISGQNTSLPHGEPSSKLIENGDLITIDFGAKYAGYCSDMTRTIAIGSINEEQKNIYNIVLQAQKTCLDNIRSGITGAEADAYAKNYIKNSGFDKYFNHSTGHCVGLNIHETPTASPREKRLLESNQVITVEPGIYLPGKFGVRIEDMVILNETGCENLTNSRKDLIIL